MCQESNVPYTDGFTSYWDPKQFDLLPEGIRLHKIHGSLLWYETSRVPRKIVKIPIKQTSATAPRFFSDDDVSASLIYPTFAKEQHVDPYATVLARFREALRQADTLIVIGYS